MALRSALLSTAILLSACGASAPTEAEAQSSAQMSDEEFDRRLREALLRNPEVILQAIEAYRATLEAEAALATRESVVEYLPELVAAESGHAIGASAEDAELIIIEFFDYHCGYCRRAMDDVLARAEANDKVRVVFQELPILRDESREASETVMAAAMLGDDAYRKAHVAMMRSGGLLNEAARDKALSRAGLKPKEVAKAAETHAEAIKADIDRSLEIARQLGVQGTPFFIVANPATGVFDILEGYRVEELEALVSSVTTG